MEENWEGHIFIPNHSTGNSEGNNWRLSIPDSEGNSEGNTLGVYHSIPQ